MRAIIEMPLGTIAKLEVSKETGNLKLDRVLSIPVPYNYGYLEGTLAGDGDPLDVFVITAAGPLPALTEVDVIPFGVWICEDGGVADEKILAHPVNEKLSTNAKMIAMRQVSEYLKSYKPGFEVIKFEDSTKAEQLYRWTLNFKVISNEADRT